jgi:plasmid stability protein
MPDILVRNLDERTLARPERRAALNSRSLQQEIPGILDRAAREVEWRDRAEPASPRPAAILATAPKACGASGSDDEDHVLRWRQ